MSFQGGKGESEQSATVDIPDYLRPFIQQATSTAGGALGNLAQLSGLGGEGMVAGLDPLQQRAQDSALGRLEGEGGFLPTAYNTLLDAAKGRGVEHFMPISAYGALDQMSAGQGLDFLSPEARATLSQSAQIPGAANEALTATARGDFLHGGAGFDAAVDAAVRSATPQVQSAFGRAGAGGGTGGLAQAAIGQSAVDAFARQYMNERSNQLGAANTLSGRGMDAAGMLGGFGEGSENRRLNAANVMSSFSDRARQRQLDAARQLPTLSMFESDVLGGFGGLNRGITQGQMDAPRMAQMQLLQAALGGLPIPSLLGQTMTGEQSGFQFGFDS